MVAGIGCLVHQLALVGINFFCSLFIYVMSVLLYMCSVGVHVRDEKILCVTVDEITVGKGKLKK